MPKWTCTFIKFFVGIGILSFLFYSIGIKEILATISTVHPVFILVVFFAIGWEHLFNGLIYKTIVKDYEISWKQYSLMSIKAWSLSIFTPGRIGDLSTIYYMNQLGIPLGKGTAFFFINRIIIFLSLLIAATGGSVLLGVKFLGAGFFLVPILFLLVFALLMFFNNFRRYLNRLLPDRVQGKFIGFSSTMKRIVRERPIRFLWIIWMQLFKLCVTNGFTTLMFLSLGQYVKWWHVIIIFSIAQMISLIPVSINGIGLKESVLVYLFGIYSGIDGAVVITVALLNQMLAYLIAISVYILSPSVYKKNGIKWV